MTKIEIKMSLKNNLNYAFNIFNFKNIYLNVVYINLYFEFKTYLFNFQKYFSIRA